MGNLNLSHLDLSILKKYLNYDKISGHFSWAIDYANYSKNDIAGSLSSSGYVSIMLFGKNYRANRLAWYYYYGVWPTLEIDHINLNKADNSIDNLREATRSQNKQNTKNFFSNKEGFRGVYASGKKFKTSIKINGIAIYLGTYTTKEKASLVYENKAKEVHGEFYQKPPYEHLEEV